LCENILLTFHIYHLFQKLFYIQNLQILENAHHAYVIFLNNYIVIVNKWFNLQVLWSARL